MPNKIVLSIFLILCINITIFCAVTDEEFVGPFASWKNVKTDFGAIGDGTTDDTYALQRALDSVANPNHSWNVLYLPAGTYKITATLTMNKTTNGSSNQGFAIFGAHPDSTVISWAGPATGNMLVIHGWYHDVERITFDGKGTATYGILKEKDFSTACMWSDLVFKDLQTGIQLGNGDGGQAENLIKRCRFYRCSFGGIVDLDWNALDNWIWSCYFEDCAGGYRSQLGHGHVYNSVFVRSTLYDIQGSMEFMAVVNNRSFGSKKFLVHPVQHTVMRGNKIYNMTDTAIVSTGAGFEMADNVFHFAAGYVGPGFADVNSSSTIVSICDTFTVTNRITSGSQYSTTKLRAISAISVLPSTITVPAIEIPQFAPNNHRKVFEVPAVNSDDAMAVQNQILAAILEPAGTWPVVHIPHGSYRFARSVVIPKRRSIQIVGDGYSNGTTLSWNNTNAADYYFKVKGPSKVVFRNMYWFSGSNAANGVLIDSADQAGGRIYGEEAMFNGYGSAAPKAGVLLNGLRQTDVTFIASGNAFCEQNMWVRGTGGATAPNNQIACFSGNGGPPTAGGCKYRVENGGNLMLEGIYCELENTGTGPTTAILDGAVNFTYASGRLYTESRADVPTVSVNNLNGAVAIMGINANPYPNTVGAFYHWFKLTGNGSNAKVAAIDHSFNAQPGWGLTAVPRDANGNCWSAYSLLQDSTSPSAQSAIMYSGLSGSAKTDTNIVAYIPPGTTNYTQFTLNFTVPANTPAVDIIFGATHISLYVDDFELTELGTTPTAVALDNPGFEQDFTGWNYALSFGNNNGRLNGSPYIISPNGSYGIPASITTSAHSGSKAALAAGNGDQSRVQTIRSKVNPGSSYRLTFWAKRPDTYTYPLMFVGVKISDQACSVDPTIANRTLYTAPTDQFLLATMDQWRKARTDMAIKVADTNATDVKFFRIFNYVVGAGNYGLFVNSSSNTNVIDNRLLPFVTQNKIGIIRVGNKIRFFVPSIRGVINNQLNIYNASGRLVRTLSADSPDNENSVYWWNGRSATNDAVSPGLYFAVDNVGHCTSLIYGIQK